VSDLPRGWAWTTLGAVCASVSKVDPATFAKQQFRYVDIASVDGNAHALSDVALVDCDKAPSRARQLLKAGDTVFSTVRPYLRKIAFIPEHFDGEVASTGFCVLRPTGVINSRFLYYLVVGDWFIDQVTRKQRGVSYPAVRPSEVLEIPIPLPPLAEQHRIVEALEDHLSRLDAASAVLASVRFRMDRLANSTALDAVQVSPGSELPEGWQWRSLESLSRGSSYGTSTKCDANGQGTPVVRIPNVRDGALSLAEMKYAADRGADLSHLHLRAGDVLFIRTNGSPSLIGRTAVVREDSPIAFASYLIRFQLGAVEIADWVQLVVSSPAWREQIVRAAASSAGQYNLNQTFLKRLTIPLPPIDERAEILLSQRESIYDFSRLAQGVFLAQSRSAALRRALLTAAFNGELVDQDPNDEPADIALARLRSGTMPVRKRAARRAAAAPVKG
jgi:type I restriction enzyme S subunit